MISKTNENIEAILGSETEKWRSKMIKVFGDLEPYCFYITYGHSDESQMKDRKADILSREKTKAQAFENLENMHEVDREAEEEFHKVLSDFENKGDVEHLNEFLEERKKECAKVFDQFDRIVALCEEYLNLEYSDCKRRVREQMAIQKPMVDEVERYLTEVQEAGDKEISLLKDNIANYIREVGLTRSSKLEEIYADMDSQVKWFWMLEFLYSR
ncbi:uncharacterized protein CDAR_413611 [Caerostris darwini]|uniref:Uncharacterized protein n=1 Tax=Caerostris darwini TaxID=1538125 RepID=A0AAV4T8X6_9ARAC|nr:uncharacterized protein CDAR_413611 [Caerostris darwini]